MMIQLLKKGRRKSHKDIAKNCGGKHYNNTHHCHRANIQKKNEPDAHVSREGPGSPIAGFAGGLAYAGRAAAAGG